MSGDDHLYALAITVSVLALGFSIIALVLSR